MSSAVSTAWLVPLSGPTLDAIELTPKEQGTLIGRHESCDVRLPSEAVSRFHARLESQLNRWQISDLKSRWGTFLNGQRIATKTSIPLREGDLISISPWTFSFSSEQSSSRGILQPTTSPVIKLWCEPSCRTERDRLHRTGWRCCWKRQR